MSKYRIGFYVHPERDYADDVHWLLTFNGKHFSFRIIEENLIPKPIDYPEINYKRVQSQSLANPVLYKENTVNSQVPIIEEIVFLREVPIRAKSELKKVGYEIYAPFVERLILSNPCLKDYLSICDFSGDLLTEASVYLDGQEITRQLPNWDESISLIEKNIILFNHLVISGVVIKHICDECYSFEKYTAFLHKPYHNYYYGYDKKASHDKGISEIIKYVDGLDIATIVDSVTANITYDHSYYRGEIDGSYYTLHLRIGKEFSNLQKDCYLSSHIRGHVLSENRYHKEGALDEQSLKRIKYDLYKDYSKIEHVACLVAEWQSYAFHLCYYKHLWDKYFSVIEHALCIYYHLDELSKKHKKFSNNFKDEIYTIYLYANREKNVEIINEGIKSSTLCNQDEKAFKSFHSDLLANIVYIQHELNCHDLKYSYDYPPGIWHNDRLSFNYDLRDSAVWPPNKDNPMVR